MECYVTVIKQISLTVKTQEIPACDRRGRHTSHSNMGRVHRLAKCHGKLQKAASSVRDLEKDEVLVSESKSSEKQDANPVRNRKREGSRGTEFLLRNQKLTNID